MTDFKNEFISSTTNALKKRINSPFYGTFIISYLIINWQFFFSIFFMSEDKIWQATGKLKNDYLISNFFNYFSWNFWILHISPFLMTILFIWVLPKFTSIPAFKKDEENKTKLHEIETIEKTKREKKSQDIDKEIIKGLNIEKEKIEKEKKIEAIDPTMIWQQEYKIMKESPYFNMFQLILDAIYKHHGNINNIEIHPQVIAFTDANGLINLDILKNRIEFTEKGKFFSKNYLNDRSK